MLVESAAEHYRDTTMIAVSAYIDPAAVIIGDVVIGEDSSVWPCAVANRLAEVAGTTGGPSFQID